MDGVIADGQLWVAIPLALLAGLVSFASPCVLPLVPGYLGYVTGTSESSSRWRPVVGVGLFILGFALVFVAYGAAFGSVGGWLIRWQDLLTRILGVVVILMGFVFIGAFRLFQRTAKLPITLAPGSPAPRCSGSYSAWAGPPALVPPWPRYQH